MSLKNACSNPSHADRPGAMYCAKCEKFYCSECEAGIHSIFFGDHIDFTTHDADNVFIGKCEKHKEYPLDYFCQEHESLCCARCKETGEEHAKCTITLFDTLDAEEIKQNFSDAVKNLELKINKIEDLSGEELEGKAMEMEQNVIKVKEEIIATCKMLHEAIDKREIELLQEVEKIYGKEDYSVLINKFRDTDEAKTLLKQGKKILENQERTKEMLHRTSSITKMVNALEKIETEIADFMCDTEKLTVSFPYKTLVQEIQSFGKVRYGKNIFVPELTVNNITHNSISGTCTRAPFNNVLYQVMTVNASNSETKIAYTGEDINFTIEGLAPETEYYVFVRIKMDDLLGKCSEGVSVKTGRDTTENFKYECANNNTSSIKTGNDPIETFKSEDQSFNETNRCSDRLFKNSHWKRMKASGSNNNMRYSIDERNPNIAKNITNGQCTIIGDTSLPSNRVTSWSIKIMRSEWEKYGDISIGVAPFDINQNKEDNFKKCGWYFECSDSTLYSGPPHCLWKQNYGIRMGLEQYVRTGDSVGVIMDTLKGELSFVLDKINCGVAYEGIPLDKPLVPCVIFWNKGDSAELIPSRVDEIFVKNDVPVPTNLHIINKTWYSLTVAWNPLAKATSYNIEIDGTIYHANSRTKSFTGDGLLQESEHRIRIRAVYIDEISKWSEYIYGKTLVMPRFGECTWKSCPLYVHKKMKYIVDERNTNIARKSIDYSSNPLCTIIGTVAIPPYNVTSWNIKVVKSRNNDGDCIYIGVAPFDINQACKDNRGECGWYFYCYTSKLYSGPPHNYNKRGYISKNDIGKYVQTGDTVGVVMDTKKVNLSFVLKGVNLGVAYKDIPLDKPLVPCVLLKHQGDSVELVM